MKFKVFLVKSLKVPQNISKKDYNSK